MLGGSTQLRQVRKEAAVSVVLLSRSKLGGVFYILIQTMPLLFNMSDLITIPKPGAPAGGIQNWHGFDSNTSSGKFIEKYFYFIM